MHRIPCLLPDLSPSIRSPKDTHLKMTARVNDPASTALGESELIAKVNKKRVVKAVKNIPHDDMKL